MTGSRGRPGASGLGLPIFRAVFRGVDGDLRLDEGERGGLAAIAFLRREET